MLNIATNRNNSTEELRFEYFSLMLIVAVFDANYLNIIDLHTYFRNTFDSRQRSHYPSTLDYQDTI